MPTPPIPIMQRQGEEEEKERAGALRQWLHQRDAGEALPLPAASWLSTSTTSSKISGRGSLPLHS